MRVINENLTPREQMTMAHEKDMFQMQSEHGIKVKELEIEATKLESRLGAWLRLPLFVLRLPVMVVLGVGVVVYAIRGIEPPQSLLELLK